MTVPRAYQINWDLGWRWFTVTGSTPHLCPPGGHIAKCGRLMPPGDRIPTSATVPVEARCSFCRKRVDLP